jgi:hypothetical protein
MNSSNCQFISAVGGFMGEFDRQSIWIITRPKKRNLFALVEAIFQCAT